MGLRPKLHPFTVANGKTYMPATCHTMSREEKENFLKVLQNVRVPDGYASNISQCVWLKERTISGLKSHDSHVLMQQLLPIALPQSLPDKVVRPLMQMSAFFISICSTKLTQDEMDRLQGIYIYIYIILMYLVGQTENFLMCMCVHQEPWGFQV